MRTNVAAIDPNMLPKVLTANTAPTVRATRSIPERTASTAAGNAIPSNVVVGSMIIIEKKNLIAI